LIQEFNSFLTTMNNSTSTNDKVETMRHVSKNIRKVLYYTYNPFIQFNITNKLLNKRKDLVSDENIFDNIFDLLNALNDRRITGHRAIKETNRFILDNPDYNQMLSLILDRNLKLRVSTKLINKACPGLIPTFNVALANKYDDKTKKKVDFSNSNWFVSRKLDGVRCLIFVDSNGNTSSYARSGKQFHTLSSVEEEIKSLGVKNVVYDGELCIVDENGNEDFQSIMKEIGRKDHTIQKCLFQVFDFIPYEIFNRGTSSTGTFSQRLTALRNVLSLKNLEKVSMLVQTPVTSFEELESLTVKATESGWEGLMLRKDSTYQGKRSNDILKVKTFFDNEYVVQDAFFGPIRYIKEGVEVEEEMLSGISIIHKDNVVRVGSGFTIDQRKHFFSNPKEIIGKTITVQYFEESQNQNGQFSLRFPVIKVIHGDERKF